ncbi:MAG TPA: ATP-binding protein [Candidatus Saccharimonadales bacterium]|nr:ATP-binding protein [Candidatus Saccharimonadales bacterium]
MDHLQALQHTVRTRLLMMLIAGNAILIATAWYGFTQLQLPAIVVIGGLVGLMVILSAVITSTATRYFITPIRALWQAILHLAPHEAAIAAPDLATLRIGRELVSSLTAQVYQLATVAEKVESTQKAQVPNLHTNFIANNLPIPLIVLDATETIQFANQAAADYVGMHVEDLSGKNVYMVLDMAFPSDATFDKWLKDAKEHSATAVSSWERVRLNVRDNHPTRLFDLAAYYNRGNPQKWETMLVLFDHTKQYSQDDQAVSFIALSVHELRTPLTLLRGYIEAFEEELGGTLTPELNDFMLKMNATAQQLTAFVNNILNVARVDDDQLQLQLQEADWSTILKSSLDSIALRAKVRGIQLEYTIAPNLPTVAVDRLSIQEVINNIIDNAIKYSGKSTVIKINSHLTQDGVVETTIQDFGVGIPTAVMPNLFTKFYRDHRNRAQIGGTGLGLYLSKAIVDAHGGNIWVRSQEGQGSTFGFTLVPYAQLAEELKNSNNNELVRGAHGWIKNHSLYRR